MVKFRRIQLKYRAHNILNGFSGFPVSKNPMLEKRIFNLSPIGKKLAGPYRVLGGHLGFWLPRAGVTTKFVRTKFFLFPKVSLRICNRSSWAVGGWGCTWVLSRSPSMSKYVSQQSKIEANHQKSRRKGKISPNS